MYLGATLFFKGLIQKSAMVPTSQILLASKIVYLLYRSVHSPRLEKIRKVRKIGKKSVNFGFFGCAAWQPSYNAAKVCFLCVECAEENFGISFVKIGCVCGKLQGKRSSDRNRSLWFLVPFLFQFASFGLKLGQHVLSG